MRVLNLRLAALALTSGLTLGGCAYGYDGYGPYGGLGVGVGYGSGYGGYGGGYGGYGAGYGNYGYGYGYPYGAYGSYGGYPYGGFGWYDDFYYPGSGYYVYDRNRHPRRWTDRERSFWMNAIKRASNNSTGATTTVRTRENWSGFNRRPNASTSVDTQGSNGSNRWRNRPSASTTTTTSDTTTTQPNRGFRHRNRSNDQ